VNVTEYQKYLRQEWEQYAIHPERFRAALELAAGRDVRQVLDVGCGAGQELLPFVQALGARVVGVDISPEAMEVAREKFARLGLSAKAEFRCSQAEQLPFENEEFDIVTCRLALPYTRNAAALAEMSRVLQPGGLLVLKIHHARYYAHRLWKALVRGRVRAACSPATVLLAGAFYHVTGRQPIRRRFFAQEVFQTRWKLRQELRSVGLAILEEMQNSDSNPRTPIFLIGKATLRPATPQVTSSIDSMLKEVPS
jgi:ubiquinone/menaquinone biosynthesis C-methylase UbiE